MKKIREQVEHLLWNYDIKDRLSLQGEGAEIFVDDLLALIPKPRTEEEILKDFEKMGYSFQTIKIGEVDTLQIEKDERLIYIYKNVKRYRLVAFNKSGIPTPDVIGVQEHKLLNELFECWGWI